MHVFNPTKYTEEELQYSPDKDIIPIVIHCVVEEGLEGKDSIKIEVCCF